MGTGWRRARNALGLSVCTSVPRELDSLDSASQADNNAASPILQNPENSAAQQLEHSNSPRLRLQLQQQQQCQTVAAAAAPSPRLRVRTGSGASPRVQSSPRMCSQTQCSPRLQCKTSVSSPKVVKNMENVPLTEGTSLPSSPRSPSRLTFLKNSLRLSRSTCAMCLQTMKPGHGHAIFTAECSHAFHFPCIASNVKHGNLICPICRAKWKELPSLASLSSVEKPPTASVSASNTPRGTRRRNSGGASTTELLASCDDTYTPRGTRQIGASEPVYDDDEPLDSSATGDNNRAFSTIHEEREEEEEEEEFEFKGFVVEPEDTAGLEQHPAAPKSNNTVEIRVEPEVGVLAANKSCENFTVLLQVKAKSAAAAAAPKISNNSSSSLLADPSLRAPIDLVTVLDVSGSMSGTKLQMLKRAMRLVINSLSASDRLSVVVFSAVSKRVLPLRRMNPQGQRAARKVVDRLVCCEGTNIADGLRKAAKILEDRRERNPVASIMLLSDGHDKHSSSGMSSVQQRQRLPGSIRQSTRYGHIEIPVHSIGFNSEEDAFAQSLGGLLSVVVQDVQLTISCSLAPGVKLNSVHAGNCQTRVLDDYASVKLGDLYAEEDREIVLELKIPAVKYANPMSILGVKCSFKDPVSQQTLYPREQTLTIPRPESVRGIAACAGVSLEVEKRKDRVRTARAVTEARAFAERGETERAQQVLYEAKTLLQLSPVSRAGDGLRAALDGEIANLQARIRNYQTYVYSRERERRRLGGHGSFNDRHYGGSTAYRRSSNNGDDEHSTASMLDIVMRLQTDSDEPLTPTSAWRAAEKLAKVAMMRKSLNRVSDLHGFENARF